MRFKKKKNPNIGDRRICSYFTFLPVTIDDEVRWLENVNIEEEYTDGGTWEYSSDMWEK